MEQSKVHYKIRTENKKKSSNIRKEKYHKKLMNFVGEKKTHNYKLLLRQ
jgi:hypothetical protein